MILRKLGLGGHDSEYVAEFCEHAGLDYDGYISREEFSGMIYSRTRGGEIEIEKNLQSSGQKFEDVKSSARELFAQIDANKQGYIYLADLETACSRVNLGASKLEMQDMMNLICREDEDYITESQFVDYFVKQAFIYYKWGVWLVV